MVAQSLARLALFADLTPEALEAFTTVAREETFPEGEWVLREGAENCGLHVILDGEAGVVVGGIERFTLHAGMYFGEISALLGDPVGASVFARSRLHCSIIESEDLFPFLLANPSVTLRLLQAETRRLSDTNLWLA